MMSRVLEVDLDMVLNLLACAEDYGFDRSILMSAFGDMTGHVTDQEIAAYTSFYVSEQGIKEGYGEEDQECITDRLKEWRDSYAKPDRHAR